jgi:hypothetical protein
MFIIVTGTEGFDDYKFLSKTLDRLTKKLKKVSILSDQSDVAKMAEKWITSRFHSFDKAWYFVYRADYARYRGEAETQNRKQMINTANAVIIFYDDSKDNESVEEIMLMAKAKGLVVKLIPVEKG